MSLNDISNGRLYGPNDMVKIGCNDCKGCSNCCHDMGDSILLDPFDIFRLCKVTGKTFEELLGREIELNLREGLILPNLRMCEDPIDNTKDPHCAFLNSEGRCSIHKYRPGICRLYPLGRNYQENSMNYFLLNDACPIKNKTKVKISKWLEIENIQAYQKYLVDWHNLTKKFRAEVNDNPDASQASALTSVFLKYFYVKPYDGDFYSDFYNRFSSLMNS